MGTHRVSPRSTWFGKNETHGANHPKGVPCKPKAM